MCAFANSKASQLPIKTNTMASRRGTKRGREDDDETTLASQFAAFFGGTRRARAPWALPTWPEDVAVTSETRTRGNLLFKCILEPQNTAPDVGIFAEQCGPAVTSMIEGYFRAKGDCFVDISFIGERERTVPVPEGIEVAAAPERSQCVFYAGQASAAHRKFHVRTASAAKQFYDEVAEVIKNSIETMEAHDGSNWTLVALTGVRLQINKYITVAGGCGAFKVPASFKFTRSIVSPTTETNCFAAAILIDRLVPSHVPHRGRVSRVKKHFGKLNMAGVAETDGTVPVDPDRFLRFEQQNPDWPINVFQCIVNDGVSCEPVMRVYASSLPRGSHEPTNLLAFTPLRGIGHYVIAANIGAIFNVGSTHKRPICGVCLQRFSEKTLISHVSEGLCKQPTAAPDGIIRQLPEHKPGLPRPTMAFHSPGRSYPTPFYVMFDTEAFTDSATRRQEARFVTLRFVSEYPDVLACKTVTFTGHGCVRQAIDQIVAWASAVRTVLLSRTPMVALTPEQSKRHYAKDSCCALCMAGLWATDDEGRERFKGHRDHDHITGLFRQSLCGPCNTKYYPRRVLPVWAHNGGRYDFHLLLPQLADAKSRLKRQIKVLPRGPDRFLSIKLKPLTTIKKDASGKPMRNAKGRLLRESFPLLPIEFKDTLNFMGSGLEALVEARTADPTASWPHFDAHFRRFDAATRVLLRCKGHMPFKAMTVQTETDWLAATTLPPIEAYTNDLTGHPLSAEHYAHEQAVWASTRCKTRLDYVRLYCERDTLLLTDAWADYCATARKAYGLCPQHYFGAPGLYKDAALRFSKASIGLFVRGEEAMADIVQVRGGYVTAPILQATANNPRMASFDVARPTSWLLMLDCVNNYGWSQRQALPLRNFRFATEGFSGPTATEAFLALPFDGPTGYYALVDLETPPAHLHAKLRDFGYAPQSVNGRTLSGIGPRIKYACDYRLLQLWLRLGIPLAKVRAVLAYDQEPFLQSWIDFNTTQRAAATSKYGQQQAKDAVNVPTGKFIENAANYSLSSKILTDLDTEANEHAAAIRASAPNTSWDLITDTMAIVYTHKQVIEDRVPRITGATTRDLGQYRLFSLYYEVLQPFWGPQNCRGLYSDTDSAYLHVTTPDAYADLLQLAQAHPEAFDFSNLPASFTTLDGRSLFSNANKFRPGALKIDCGPQIPIEYQALGPKQYAFRFGPSSGSNDVVKASGFAKGSVTFEMIKAVKAGKAVEPMRRAVIKAHAGCVSLVATTRTLHATAALASDLSELVDD